MQFGVLTLKLCKYGWMLFKETLSHNKFIGKALELYGEYSESEIEAMRPFLRPGDVAIDIGAFIGDMTLPFAQIVGSEGRVYAFEPDPETFNILCANLALNEVANVKPINALVKTGAAANDRSAMAIDDLNLSACRLIKIDVDGFELDVLRSGAKTIERLRPVLYLENDRREKSQALLEYLLAFKNYSFFWHFPPAFSPDNFAGNPVNHWAPQMPISIMILGVPDELGLAIHGLRRVERADEWQ